MPGPFVHSNPRGTQPIASSSKPRQGSKLKHTLAVASSSSKNSTPAKASNKKRSREADEDGDDSMGEQSSASDGGDDMEGVEDVEDGENDTDDEISMAKQGRSASKKQKTKKKAPTTASTFGATLTSLLADPTPSSSSPAATAPKPKSKIPKSQSQPILSLSKAPLPPSKSQVHLERKAARIIKQEKAEREDRARVRDVIEGWAPATPIVSGVEVVGSQEFEKGLRKTAQRGVIKLFNAILAASKAAEEQDMSLSARAGVKADMGSRKEKDNVLGRGSREELTKESFLELVKKGGR